MDKKISVIVPVYNSEKTIKRCVESVLKQSYQNFELILVDDGSLDNSLEICNNYKKQDKRVIVISKKNGGASSARNCGLNNARGDYINFLDSDDSIEEDYLKLLIEKFHKDVDLVVCAIKIVANKIRMVEFDDEGEFNPNSFDLYKQKNFYGLISSPCNKLYKKEKILDYFPENVKNGEDAIFNIHYLKNCKKILITNKIIYNYFYENPNSMTKKYSTSRFKDAINVYGEFTKFLNFEKNILQEKFINRWLLRDICSISKSLCKYKNFSEKEKFLIIKNMISNSSVQLALKNYCTCSISEKVAFFLMKKNLVRIFYKCCKKI
jgi:glycosyltransferase involved in cell wall biosynthesis